MTSDSCQALRLSGHSVLGQSCENRSQGKVSFTDEQIAQNSKALYDTVAKARPNTVKGVFMKSVTVSTTKGPGVKVTVE